MAPDHLDDAELDPRHRPQDDLFAHVNQRWIDETPIPSDRAAYGTFYQLADEAERASRALLESCVSADPGTLERQLGDLYGAFMDEAAIDALGVTPVAPRLAAVAALRSMTEWGALVGSLTREGLAGVVSLFVDTDPGDPERYRVFLEQGGLSLPDESYYREERFAAVREAFAEHVARVLALAGLDDAVARAPGDGTRDGDCGRPLGRGGLARRERDLQPARDRRRGGRQRGAARLARRA